MKGKSDTAVIEAFTMEKLYRTIPQHIATCTAEWALQPTSLQERDRHVDECVQRQTPTRCSLEVYKKYFTTASLWT